MASQVKKIMHDTELTRKLIGLAVGAAAGFAAEKLGDFVWKYGFRRPLPSRQDPSEPVRDIILFTAVTAVVSSVVQELLMRKIEARLNGWEAKRKAADM